MKAMLKSFTHADVILERRNLLLEMSDEEEEFIP